MPYSFDPNKFAQVASSLGISAEGEDEKRRLAELALKRKNEGFISRNLPTIGAIGAGLIAAPFTGGMSLPAALAIAGVAGAGGAAAGTVGRSKLRNEPVSGTEVAKEALVGGVGNATGELIGPAFKGIMAAFGRGGAEAAAGATAKAGMTTAEELAAKTAKAAFTVPRAVADRLNPTQTMNSILNYGINPKTLGGLQKVVDSVTGSTGVINKAVTEAASAVKTPISLDNVFTGMKNMGDTLTELSPKELITIKKEISRLITPNNAEVGILKTTSLDALDAIRKLETQGYKFHNASSRSLLGGDKLTLGAKAKLYLGAADELKMSLEQAVGQAGVDAIKTPELMLKLSQISPKLADEVMKATNLSQLRSIQSPFVRLGQMIKETNNAAESVVAQGGNKLTGKLTGGAAGYAVGNVPGAIAGYMAEPVVEAAAQNLRAPLLMSAAKIIRAGGKVAPTVARGAKLAIGQDVAGKVINPAPPDTPSDLYMPTEDQLNSDISQSSNIKSTQTSKTKTGIDNEMLQALMMEDILRTGGKNVDKLSAIASLNPKEEMSTADKTRQDNIITALAALDGAETNLVTAGGAKGPIMGAIATTPLGQIFDAPGAAYHKTKVEVATQMAKAITGGSRPAESVINKYLVSLPDVNDTKDYASQKLQKLRNELLQQAKAFGYTDVLTQYQ